MINFSQFTDLDSVEQIKAKLNNNFSEIDRRTPWIDVTFENSWVNFGSTWSNVSYHKDLLGYVHLRGLAKSGTVAYQTAVFTLPTGYRPSTSLMFSVDSNAAFGRVAIESNGIVSVVTGNNTHVSFDGITFKSEL